MRLSDINNILKELSATVSDHSPWGFIGTLVMKIDTELAAMLSMIKHAKNAGQVASSKFTAATRICT